jgi:hypothetical protein
MTESARYRDHLDPACPHRSSVEAGQYTGSWSDGRRPNYSNGRDPRFPSRTIPARGPWQADLIEACVRIDRLAEAERELEVLERRARMTGSVWAAAAALRCRGLLAARDRFEQWFERALALHSTQPLPLERARTELCLGEVARVVAAGASNAQAAAQLFVAPKTVEKHLTSAYRKLGVRSRAQLAAKFALTQFELEPVGQR